MTGTLTLLGYATLGRDKRDRFDVWFRAQAFPRGVQAISLQGDGQAVVTVVVWDDAQQRRRRDAEGHLETAIGVFPVEAPPPDVLAMFPES